MSRADEIAQGLRHESGSLTFALNALEYSEGFVDAEAGNPPPKFSTASYDLGRARANERREVAQQLAEWDRCERERRDNMMREVCKDRPDVLAEYFAKMDEIAAKYPRAQGIDTRSATTEGRGPKDESPVA